ncbi:MAG TPA: hypothetical protein PLB32_16825 [Acidobacteriota bacterium]|nr:hypothetical protein [Acidobacteriota bacterium]
MSGSTGIDGVNGIAVPDTDPLEGLSGCEIPGGSEAEGGWATGVEIVGVDGDEIDGKAG